MHHLHTKGVLYNYKSEVLLAYPTLPLFGSSIHIHILYTWTIRGGLIFAVIVIPPKFIPSNIDVEH